MLCIHFCFLAALQHCNLASVWLYNRLSMFGTGESLLFAFFLMQYLQVFFVPLMVWPSEGKCVFLWVCHLYEYPLFFFLSHSLLWLLLSIAFTNPSLAQTSLLLDGLQICSSSHVCLTELKDFYQIPLPSLRVFLQLLASSFWGMCSIPGIELGWTSRPAGESTDRSGCVLLPFSRTVLQLLFWSYPSDPVSLQGYASNRFWPSGFRFLGKPLWNAKQFLIKIKHFGKVSLF